MASEFSWNKILGGRKEEATKVDGTVPPPLSEQERKEIGLEPVAGHPESEPPVALSIEEPVVAVKRPSFFDALRPVENLPTIDEMIQDSRPIRAIPPEVSVTLRVEAEPLAESKVQPLSGQDLTEAAPIADAVDPELFSEEGGMADVLGEWTSPVIHQPASHTEVAPTHEVPEVAHAREPHSFEEDLILPPASLLAEELQFDSPALHPTDVLADEPLALSQEKRPLATASELDNESLLAPAVAGPIADSEDRIEAVDHAVLNAEESTAFLESAAASEAEREIGANAKVGELAEKSEEDAPEVHAVTDAEVAAVVAEEIEEEEEFEAEAELEEGEGEKSFEDDSNVPKNSRSQTSDEDFGPNYIDEEPASLIRVGDKPLSAAGHYRPGELPSNVHEIDVREKRFEHSDLVANDIEVDADAIKVSEAHIDDILRMAIERKASDIHLTASLPPMVRMDGEIVPLPFTVLTAEDTQRLVYDTLTNEHVQKFENTHELDFAYSVKGLARFRFNVYMQRGTVAGALRVIPTKIPSFETLGLPPIIREIAKRSSGLILVTGPTGSGKTTTIASMIDDINESRQAHILTIEDPVEYLHRHKKCMVNQREMHADTFSFHAALRAVLREDPDIILVGELRDLETIEAALQLAETGHLVFGTLHTRNAPSTIDRIIDVFPSDQQDQIRVLLGNTLEGVVSQQLIPKLGGGRCAAIEIMLGTPAIKNMIREGKTHQMYSSIETGAKVGMQTMDNSLANHFKNGYCAFEELMMRAVDKETFSRLAKH